MRRRVLTLGGTLALRLAFAPPAPATESIFTEIPRQWSQRGD